MNLFLLISGVKTSLMMNFKAKKCLNMKQYFALLWQQQACLQTNFEFCGHISETLQICSVVFFIKLHCKVNVFQ